MTSIPSDAAPPRFRVTHRDGRARRGELRTPHGLVRTPAFMPVGTRGTVKALTHRQLVEVGAQLLLANTYHLHVRPGDDLIARAGGLHRFIGWDRPILTDSGGYQVFSLAGHRVVAEDGVRFRSHLDGRALCLTPETVVDIQARLGSDVAMVLDECVAYPASMAEAERAVARTRRWAERARGRIQVIRNGTADVAVTNHGQATFGIVQGSVFPALREASRRATLELDFDGYAIGGLSVGEPVELMYRVVDEVAEGLPADRPRYLMGAGMPDDLVESVARGVDLFDCVLPTRNARNGQLLTRQGRLVIKQARFADDPRPPDPACGCYTCRHFSRAYLRHLYLVGEMTAATLNTLHNLYFYLDTMDRIRNAIELGSFDAFRHAFRETYTRRAVTEP
jgi:queuine tRNA-ribosyltransferase